MPAFAGILAAPVALQLVDRRWLRSPHDVKRDGLVPVAAKAADFEWPYPAMSASPSVGDGAAGP
jgi:hypothetical protein